MVTGERVREGRVQISRGTELTFLSILVVFIFALLLLVKTLVLGDF